MDAHGRWVDRERVPVRIPTTDEDTKIGHSNPSTADSDRELPVSRTNPSSNFDASSDSRRQTSQFLTAMLSKRLVNLVNTVYSACERQCSTSSR